MAKVKKKAAPKRKLKQAKTKQYDASKPLRSILQEAFISNLLKGAPQYQAYKDAGYSSKSKNSLEVCSTQLLSNPKIKARLDYKRGQLAKKADITAERVIAELARIGFANLQDFLDTGNAVQDLTKLPRELTAAVESVQTDIRHDGGKSEGYTEKVKFKLHSKVAALDKLAQHLGLYEADNNQKRQIVPVIVTFIEAAEEIAKQIESKIINDSN